MPTTCGSGNVEMNSRIRITGCVPHTSHARTHARATPLNIIRKHASTHARFCLHHTHTRSCTHVSPGQSTVYRVRVPAIISNFDVSARTRAKTQTPNPGARYLYTHARMQPVANVCTRKILINIVRNDDGDAERGGNSTHFLPHRVCVCVRFDSAAAFWFRFGAQQHRQRAEP